MRVHVAPLRRTVFVSLLWMLPAAGACNRDAIRPPPAAKVAPAVSDAGPPMSGAGYVTPPPADVSAPPADAEREPNGVARKILATGKGTVHPAAKRTYVELRYAGWQRDGSQFEGTGASGETRRVDITDLVDGLQQEIVQMVEGDKRRLWVPAALAYGNRTNFTNAPKGDMTYELELVHVIPLPPVPVNVAGAPKDAKSTKTTKSGLVYEVLVKGAGKKRLTETSHANVVYTAWKPDGTMFQCSLISGDVTRVLVKRLPPGWKEAMLMMAEGSKWRLWLPGKLAFGELRPGEEVLPFGPPPGPVVFEVELVKILD
jgi:FKBP-type peptidyl-prolyl cis-trans isomerase